MILVLTALALAAPANEDWRAIPEEAGASIHYAVDMASIRTDGDRRSFALSATSEGRGTAMGGSVDCRTHAFEPHKYEITLANGALAMMIFDPIVAAKITSLVCDR